MTCRTGLRLDGPDAEEVQSQHLEGVGRGQAAELDAAAGHVQPGDAPLVLRRSPDAVDLPAMFRHVAGGENVGVRSGQKVVDHHAAVNLQSGLRGQLAVGADAGGDDDQVGGDAFALLRAGRLRTRRSPTMACVAALVRSVMPAVAT